MKKLLVIGLVASTTACNSGSNSGVNKMEAPSCGTSKVIYGSDDRFDLYQVDDYGLLEQARSTMALVWRTSMVKVDDTYHLKVSNHGRDLNLCETERFREQNSVAFCSGSLVGPDLVLTAGHCAEMCGNTAFVFDFSVEVEGEIGPKVVPAKNVYNCSRVEAFELDFFTGTDYALLRLDRPVEDRKALKINRTNQLKVGDGLYVIGHPSGLPTKIAGNARVRTLDHRPFFYANLDSYKGNSGSAVFNEVTGEIEGILVTGEQDFVSNGVCNVSNRCPDGGCRGEGVTKISLLSQKIPELPSDMLVNAKPNADSIVGPPVCLTQN